MSGPDAEGVPGAGLGDASTTASGIGDPTIQRRRDQFKQQMHEMHVPPEQQGVWESVYDKIVGKRTLDDPTEKQAIIEELRGSDIKKQQAEIVLEGALYLDDDIRNDIINQLEEMSEAEIEAAEQENIAEQENDAREAQVEELQTQINETVNTSSVLEEQKQAYRDKVSGILEKFNGKTAKKLRKWGGRTLFWSVIIALVLLLQEAKLINSMVGNRGRQ